MKRRLLKGFMSLSIISIILILAFSLSSCGRSYNTIDASEFLYTISSAKNLKNCKIQDTTYYYIPDENGNVEEKVLTICLYADKEYTVYDPEKSSKELEYTRSVYSKKLKKTISYNQDTDSYEVNDDFDVDAMFKSILNYNEDELDVNDFKVVGNNIYRKICYYADGDISYAYDFGFLYRELVFFKSIVAKGKYDTYEDIEKNKRIVNTDEIFNVGITKCNITNKEKEKFEEIYLSE